MNDRHKQYKVVVHDEAAEMLYSHIKFLTKVSVPAARKLRAALQKGMSSLNSMPHRCPIFKTHSTSNVYRQLVIGRYIALYSIDEINGIVNINHILDTRQDNDI